MHASLTINFIRSLSAAGFADLHHPEYWDLSFFKRSDLHPGGARGVRANDARALAGAPLHGGARRARGRGPHAGRLLHEPRRAKPSITEAAQTRTVPRRAGYYDLTVHLPWIGERTRALDGAHVEFFRGIRNPVGVKVGPNAPPDEIVRLIDRLNPTDEAGKIVLIASDGSGGNRARPAPH